jgi:hypothetical protein
MADGLKFKGDIPSKELNALGKKLKRLKRPVRRNEANTIARRIRNMMINLISVGLSPIRGRKRFEGYRGSYRAQIAGTAKKAKKLAKKRKASKEELKKTGGYVWVKGRKVSKNLRPVNLKLTGDMLANLKYWVERDKTGWSANVGYTKKSEKLKEEGHRKGGTDKYPNTQGVRPTIPQADQGEEFAIKIRDVYLKFFDDSIEKRTKGRK